MFAKMRIIDVRQVFSFVAFLIFVATSALSYRPSDGVTATLGDGPPLRLTQVAVQSVNVIC